MILMNYDTILLNYYTILRTTKYVCTVTVRKRLYILNIRLNTTDKMIQIKCICHYAQHWSHINDVVVTFNLKHIFNKNCN